jgi:hypothetical protein
MKLELPDRVGSERSWVDDVKNLLPDMSKSKHADENPNSFLSQ